MQRLSSRLQANGYYGAINESTGMATRRINYYEPPVRKYKKSMKLKKSQMSLMSQSTQCSEKSGSSESNMFGMPNLQSPSCETGQGVTKFMAFLLMLLLIFAPFASWMLCLFKSYSPTLYPCVMDVKSMGQDDDSGHIQGMYEESSLGPNLTMMENMIREPVRDNTSIINRIDHVHCRCPDAENLINYAQESKGASVIMSRCSDTYKSKSRLTLFGFNLWHFTKDPSTAIKGSPLVSGDCWPFEGSKGTLAVSLSHPVHMTHVTVEHISRFSAPRGTIASSPKDFEVYGIDSQTGKETFTGRFMYDQFGEPSQLFNLDSPGDEVYDAAELRILSNWGHADYTCLYRFHVHGHMQLLMDHVLDNKQI